MRIRHRVEERTFQIEGRILAKAQSREVPTCLGNFVILGYCPIGSQEGMADQSGKVGWNLNTKNFE